MYQLFFVSSFSIAKNAEWTWTEFYWRTFHSETRVSSEDSRLLLLQMEPVYCSQTQCRCTHATCMCCTPPMTSLKWLLVDEPRGHWGYKNIVGDAMKMFLCKKKFVLNPNPYLVRHLRISCKHVQLIVNSNLLLYNNTFKWDGHGQ